MQMMLTRQRVKGSQVGKKTVRVTEGREGTINSVWDKHVCTGLYS